ncbi:MAG: chlorite dismutase family protein [Candidatus Caenarcaniphilales bacterium]|nr:chlorite dismutase family protein [Candidatus Caenarcaniphilales bacterium]
MQKQKRARWQPAFFAGTDSESDWQIDSIKPLIYEALSPTKFLTIGNHSADPPSGAHWILRGMTSNLRYLETKEREKLIASESSLGRVEAAKAALIPIRKSADWWDLAQDERRKIIESESRHISNGTKYVPFIARRLFHSRDLGEPFDFLTWFEFAPEYVESFEELLVYMRKSREWHFVEREVDIRLIRVSGDNLKK